MGSDLGLGAKIRFLDQSGLVPAVAALLAVSLPTGSSGVTSDGFDPRGALLFQWDLTERLGLVANARFEGPTQGTDDAVRIFQFRPQLSFEAALGGGWGAFVEYYGEIKSAGKEDEHSLDGGFTFLVNDDLQLDLSAGGGLNQAAPEWFVSAGFAWRFRFLD